MMLPYLPSGDFLPTEHAGGHLGVEDGDNGVQPEASSGEREGEVLGIGNTRCFHNLRVHKTG